MTPYAAHPLGSIRESGRRLTGSGRLLIVANRLPWTVRVDGGSALLSPSSGGLATGLSSVQTEWGGIWIGWPGIAAGAMGGNQPAIERQLREANTRTVSLSQNDIAGFYQRFANGVLWPALHDMPVGAEGAADWRTYRAANLRFADAVTREVRPGDRIWTHDYQLMLLPRILRERIPSLSIGFFLHTPFPATGLATVSQARVLLDGVLGADVVAFHTQAYVERFASAVRAVLGYPVELAAGAGTADNHGRPVSLHASPMGIDVGGFAARAADPRVPARVARLRAAGRPLFVGVDRLDPTKGIPERLEAFGRLLDARPALRGRARLLQLSVPSRQDVPAYRELRARVDQIAGEINARFGSREWRPIEHVFDSVDPVELCALYRAADVMVVTPLCDGMNLVAKEFVASRTDQQGVLVLSDQAGAAAELTATLRVNPRDANAMTGALAAALEMSPAEQRVRMRRLRARVQAQDTRRWAEECLRQLEGAVRLRDRVFPGRDLRSPAVP
jgi:trehalose 6-phosphate synthase/phosphatase